MSLAHIKLEKAREAMLDVEDQLLRLSTEAKVRSDKNLASSSSVDRDASLIQEGMRSAYQHALDLVREKRRAAI